MSERSLRWQAWILRKGLKLLSSTWRVREEIPAECASILHGEERAIIAFWHGKMFPVWYRFCHRRYAALISASRDGELLFRYLSESLGYEEVIRGSSSKGGSRALAEMTDVLGRRTCLITPDGPRGPAREGKPGALIAAQRTGLRIMLVTWSCRRTITLRSWDRMEIPYPFSLLDFRYCIFALNDNERKTEMDTGEEKGDRGSHLVVEGEGRVAANHVSESQLRRFNIHLSEL
jgi:lysophospholipid acyltransferase (LPLAT)-like uncharacterized protein